MVLRAPNRQDNASPDICRLIDERDGPMTAVTSALVRRATDLVVSGKDQEMHPETIGKLLRESIFSGTAEIYI